MIKPLSDRVLLEKTELETKTSSGIILSEGSQEKLNIGKVLAVGPGKMENGRLIEVDLKVNDKVIYKPYGVTEVKHEGKTLLIVESKDILAVMEE